MFRGLNRRALVGWLGASCIAAIAGCDQRSDSPTAAPAAATTRPAATQSAPHDGASTTASTAPTESASAVAAPVFLYVMEGDQPARMEFFPAGRLDVRADDGEVHGVLSSDDPRSAVRGDYRGNSYEFHFRFAKGDAAELTGRPWPFKAESATAATDDSDDGIYLDGFRRHVVPLDAIIVFEGTGRKLTAKIAGQFRVFSPETEGQLPQTVVVRGELPVTVKTR